MEVRGQLLGVGALFPLLHGFRDQTHVALSHGTGPELSIITHNKDYRDKLY